MWSFSKASDYSTWFSLFLLAASGLRRMEATVEIIKRSSDRILGTNSRGSSTYSARRPICGERAQHRNPVMRWMTCMAACDKEHSFFKQAHPRFHCATFKSHVEKSGLLLCTAWIPYYRLVHIPMHIGDGRIYDLYCSRSPSYNQHDLA